MKKTILALLASVLFMAVAVVAATQDVTAPIHQFIDGFNNNDLKSIYAAYVTGDIIIVDEFAPHRRFGPHAPQEWVAAYEKHALATSVSDGIVKCGARTRTEIEGDVAYVIVPTIYTYKERGKPLAEEGQMTFVLHREAAGWKISRWTWSGVKPHQPSSVWP